MVNECLIFKMPLVKKEEEKGSSDGIELSLELSIGGNYGKGKNDEPNDKSDVGQENDGGVVDLLKKREIQALRRQEARKKREEKLLTSSRTGVAINGDKLVLEAQQFQNRAEGREIKENEDLLCRKREKNGVRDQVDDNDLNLSLFSEKKKQQPYMKYPGVVPPWGLNGSGVSSMDCDSSEIKSNGKNEGGGNCSLERSSSVASDYQGISLKGEINSDAGSHSSIPNTNLHLHAPRARNTYELLEGKGSSSQTEMVPLSSTPQGSHLPFKSSQQSEEDPSENQTTASMKQASECLTERPPKPPINNNPGTSLPHMPCVSATGNGPNGKTITGFLYKYTKSEVCILCACHGSSFSPAGFVEHAGCTNVSHPLRHITIIPSTLTYRIQ